MNIENGNRIINPYVAIINGTSTGLAGCSRSTTCLSAGGCIRANEQLKVREDMNPLSDANCRLYIPN